MMPWVRCPDCGATVDLEPGTESGAVVECPNCAGHGLRVYETDGGWSARLAHRVSCPDCAAVLILPDDARAGQVIRCCDRTYRLTFEFGAFAAEPE